MTSWYRQFQGLFLSRFLRCCHRFGTTQAGMSTWPRRLDLLSRPFQRVRRLPRDPPHRAELPQRQVLLLLPRLYPHTA